MRKPFTLVLLLFFACAQAQDSTVKQLREDAAREIKKDDKDSIPLAWKTGGIYNLALTQGALNNWAAGGENFSLSVTSVLNLFAFYQKGRHSWDNILDFNLGYVNTTSLGARKNDDRLDLLSKYGYALSDKWNLAGLFNFRSQLFKGYTYDDDGAEIFSSAFLAPAYFTTGIGFDHKPGKTFSLFLSPLTSRLVLVQNDVLAAQGAYGVEPGRNSRTELGAFLTANYIKAFNETVSYRGRLDLFSNYRNKPGNVDLFMTNLLAVKISKLLSFTWNVDFIYDDDVRIFGDNGTSPALQVKSLLGAGLQVKMSNIKRIKDAPDQ